MRLPALFEDDSTREPASVLPDLTAPPGPFSRRTVLSLGALILLAGGVLRMAGVPLPYDTVVGVAAVLPVLHLRGTALGSDEYAYYVKTRPSRGLLLDAISTVVGATALGGLVVWAVDRYVGPSPQLLWGLAAAASLVGGGLVLYLLVALSAVG